MSLGKALDVSLDFLMSDQVVELSGVEFASIRGPRLANVRAPNPPLSMKSSATWPWMKFSN